MVPREYAALDATLAAVDALTADVRAAAARLRALTPRVRDLRARLDALVAEEQAERLRRVRIAGPRARLLSDALVLDGAAASRMQVRRTPVGAAVARPLRPCIGVERCETAAADVRELWQRLLALERACVDDVLRGSPSSVLEARAAAASVDATGALRVRLAGAEAPALRAASYPVVAVPRFAYAMAPRKRNNFGHWLLDCLPHVVALASIAPDAAFLVPEPVRRFHRATFELIGVSERQLVPWTGDAVYGDRLVVLESDGRVAGGRPLSPLEEMRRVIAARTPAPSSRTRRIYVSRRDAKPKRRWLANEPDVEALFARRGFDVVCMADLSLDAQVRLFQESAVVAGISGAGLADIVCAAPGTQVIVLLSDSLLRWYADDVGTRSLWVSGERIRDRQVSALGDSPRFYAHLAAACEQVCHTFVGSDVLPVDRLETFLDEALP